MVLIGFVLSCFFVCLFFFCEGLIQNGGSRGGGLVLMGALTNIEEREARTLKKFIKK